MHAHAHVHAHAHAHAHVSNCARRHTLHMSPSARSLLRPILLCVFTRRGGANTAHTQMGRPTHEAPTREYTHKHTQAQTNAQRGPTKYGAGSLLYEGSAMSVHGAEAT